MTKEPIHFSINGRIYNNFALPHVNSIVCADPNPTQAAQAHYTITFSEGVTSLDLADLDLVADSNISGASIHALAGSGQVYTLTVNCGTGYGNLRLKLTDNDSIRDSDGSPLGGAGMGNGDLLSDAYIVDRIDQPVYVNAAAPAGGDGLSWATACRTIQEGLNRAGSLGASSFWVAEGIYFESITMAPGRYLFGGFAMTETHVAQRDLQAHETIINAGRGGRHCVTFNIIAADTRLDGFTITGGLSQGTWWEDDCGGGIYMNCCDKVTVANCRIVDNYVDKLGGGIYIEGYARVAAGTSCCSCPKPSSGASTGTSESGPARRDWRPAPWFWASWWPYSSWPARARSTCPP